MGSTGVVSAAVVSSASCGSCSGFVVGLVPLASGVWIDGVASPMLSLLSCFSVGYGASGSSVGLGLTVLSYVGVDAFLPILVVLLISLVALALLILHLVYSAGKVVSASVSVSASSVQVDF